MIYALPELAQPEVTVGMLEELVAPGLRADRRRLFVIDGAKALRQAVDRVFGSSNLVQRCRSHKTGERIEPSAEGAARADACDAASRVEAGGRRGHPEAGAVCVVGGAEWLSAAASLREGLVEMFTVNRLGLPQPLRRCVTTTTNIIDSSHARVRQHTNRVSRWRNETIRCGGGGDVPGDREALSSHPWLSVSVDAEGAPR